VILTHEQADDFKAGERRQR
jgi:hypothetical protein